MLSFNVDCNPSIAETRTRPAHRDAGVTDTLSFKVACSPTWKMVAEIKMPVPEARGVLKVRKTSMISPR